MAKEAGMDESSSLVTKEGIMNRWGVLWLLSLVLAAALASVLTFAQVRQKVEPRVLSGAMWAFASRASTIAANLSGPW